MGIFSNMKEKFSAQGSAKRVQKAEQKQVSTRKEYLLSEETPFDVTEAFRNLKASISVSVPKKEGGIVIMTTSAYPKDGKTMVTVNLALMFAQSNVKVILVDADIRKGRVARFFKRKSTPGLADYLSGQCGLEEIVHQSHLSPNLSYITCGTHSPKPYELLESEEMKGLLKELRAKYDYVLIDTSPVLLVSDSLALATEVDGAMLVCRQYTSYVSDIARALNTLQFSKVNVLGVVVNDYKTSKTTKMSGSYKKYRYYHSYGYGYDMSGEESADNVGETADGESAADIDDQTANDGANE